MRIPFFYFNKICLSILFLFIGLTTSAQNFDTLRLEYNFKIRLEADSILLIKKSRSFSASAFVTSQNEICLNSNVMDSEHYLGSGICYELEGLQNGNFVPYRELESRYALDVNFSGNYYSELSKELSYDFNPFAYHHPDSKRIYRYRIFFRLQDSIINQSEWKYVYVVRKKKQISELENWSQLVKESQLKIKALSTLSLDSCLKQAEMCLKQKRFEMSREYSLKAIGMDSLCGEAYLLIGYAYVEFTRSLEVKYFHKKLILCLAVEKFRKAMEVDPSVTEKAELCIESYSRYFLLRDEFHGDFEDGDKFRLNYWINEEVTFRYSD